MSNLLNYLNKIIDFNYEKLDTVKRVNGVIVKNISKKVTYGSYTYTGYSKYQVKIIDSDTDKTKIVNLLNKSGQRLSVGNRVLIYYWNTITDGYIALKLGLDSKLDTKDDKTESYLYTMTDDIETIKKISTNVHYIKFNPEFVPFDDM